MLTRVCLPAALKEAIQASVLEERKQVGLILYRFTHAFFRQTLYEEMIAPQRLQLHQQVARSLESQYAGRLEEHASELAEHFSQSTDRDDLKKAVTYSEMAAQRAMSVFAYGEAVRLLGQAVKIQRVLDAKDKLRICDLLLSLGESLTVAGEARHALDTEIPEALSLAESVGDDSIRASKACTLAINSMTYFAGTTLMGTPEWARWAEQAYRYAEPDTEHGLGRLRPDVPAKRMLYNRTKQLEDYSEGLRLLGRAYEPLPPYARPASVLGDEYDINCFPALHKIPGCVDVLPMSC